MDKLRTNKKAFYFITTEKKYVYRNYTFQLDNNMTDMMW